MIRFPATRSHLTLALGAIGMAVALASVPTSSFTEEQSKAIGWHHGGDFFSDYDDGRFVRIAGHMTLVKKRPAGEQLKKYVSGVDESDYTFDLEPAGGIILPMRSIDDPLPAQPKPEHGSQHITNPKIYAEILTAPSDDADRSGQPLSYVICTGTRGAAADPKQPEGPTDTVVFPVESPAAAGEER